MSRCDEMKNLERWERFIDSYEAKDSQSRLPLSIHSFLHSLILQLQVTSSSDQTPGVNKPKSEVGKQLAPRNVCPLPLPPP